MLYRLCDVKRFSLLSTVNNRSVFAFRPLHGYPLLLKLYYRNSCAVTQQFLKDTKNRPIRFTSNDCNRIVFSDIPDGMQMWRSIEIVGIRKRSIHRVAAAVMVIIDHSCILIVYNKLYILYDRS